MPINSQKEEFAAQADPEVLNALRGLAEAEGRQLQALIDEALREYVERKKGIAPRRHVMTALDESISLYDGLYAKLAK